MKKKHEELKASNTNADSLRKYYRFHSIIYDYTRWAFLFGRNRIIEESAKFANPRKILEVGCGTGKNLVALHKRFPKAELTGMDLSRNMLDISEKKMLRVGANVKIIEGAYGKPSDDGGEKFDLILFSYCLSMINPGWEDAIIAAKKDLNTNGIIAVVDFKISKWKFFRNWMRVNHVRMEDQIPQFLNENFIPLKNENIAVYSGLWSYFVFIGKIQ